MLNRKVSDRGRYSPEKWFEKEPPMSRHISSDSSEDWLDRNSGDRASPVHIHPSPALTIKERENAARCFGVDSNHFLITFSLLCLLSAGILSRSHAQDSPQAKSRVVSPFISPKEYVCYQANKPIQIDGKLDDEAWTQAPWTDEFVDIEGVRKPLPRFRTRAKMLWDDQYFYVGAEMIEPHVWGTLTAHDSVIFHDNDFEVFIDPNADNHEYYEFEMNALNTGWDLLLNRPYKDGGRAVNAWEIPGLKTAVSIDGTLNDHRDTDRSWSVELAFPWKVLGELAYLTSPPRNMDQWRVNFSRVEWQHEIVNGQYRKVPNTKEDNWVWSPQGVINMHRPESWGLVQFSTDKSGSVPFQKDHSLGTRHLLHEVYYSQLDYRKPSGRWAKSIQELGFVDKGSGISQLSIDVVGDLFQASSQITRPDGQKEKWHIRQDSRIWKELVQ